MQRLFAPFCWLCILGLVALHAVASCRVCDGAKSFQTEWPYFSDDHPLHYVSAKTTRQFFAESGTNAGYDPSFMSGYAKSTYWPTNAQLELAMATLSRWFAPAQIYKGFVLASISLIPLAVAVSARVLGASSFTALLATWLWLVQYYVGFPFHTMNYLNWGMTAFLSSISWCLLTGVSATRWLRTASWIWAIPSGLFAALALMAHPTTAVILGPPCIAAWVAAGFHRSRARIGQTLVAVGMSVALNYWWIVPLFTLRSTVGSEPGFFVNPNVLERFVDLVRWDPRVGVVPLPPVIGMCLLAAALWWRKIGLLPLLCVAWILILSIPAGAIESLAFLQLGRNTFHLFTWLCIPAAIGAVDLLRGNLIGRAIGVLVLSWIAVGTWPRVMENCIDSVRGKGEIANSAVLWPAHRKLASALREHAAPRSRVFFETCEGSNEEVVGKLNPFGAFRVAPLVPELTSLEFIGGPYLTTHYKANFAQVGDGEFLHSKEWSRERFLKYATIYAVDTALFWSPPAQKFARSAPDLLQEKWSANGFTIYHIVRPKASWEEAGLKLSARPNVIEIENPKGAKGRFVIPYHWTPGWSAEPATPIESTPQGEDPAPFLTIVDPPQSLVLRFSPWRLR